MSVYTEVSRDVLATFLDNYSLGNVLAFQGILEGIENSNFFSWFITLYVICASLSSICLLSSSVPYSASLGNISSYS